jgi:hypothetical protein
MWVAGAGTMTRCTFASEGVFTEEADGGAEDRPGVLVRVAPSIPATR